jgi:hypothetical protein
VVIFDPLADPATPSSVTTVVRPSAENEVDSVDQQTDGQGSEAATRNTVATIPMNPIAAAEPAPKKRACELGSLAQP